ncbi:hypothetical protein KFU94_26600 [Chloroflexi bacterium TSY]|nr:hypothetical protein [Chloroflexi bacterium TSY]
MLQGVRHFGERLRVVYTPHGGYTQELRAGGQISVAFQEAALVKHLERLDFANAEPLLAELDVQPGVEQLAAYAAARLNFDFASAQGHLQGALRDGDRPVRHFVKRNRALLTLETLTKIQDEPLRPDRLLQLLGELYWNASITYEHRRYADFLGRVYRFQEAVLRYLVEVIFDLSTDLHPAQYEETITAWTSTIQANASLLDYLETQENEKKPLNWREINRPTFQRLVSYAIKQEGKNAYGAGLLAVKKLPLDKYKALFDRLNGLERLVALRHRTIIGHDFQGVSKELLDENIQLAKNEQSSVDRLMRILLILGVDVRQNPYELVAELILSRLR